MNPFSLKIFFFLSLSLLILRLGFFYFFPLQLVDGQKIHFSATLLEDTKTVGGKQQFFLTYGSFWQSATILIQTKEDTQYMYGQELEVIGTVKEKLLKNKKLILTIQNPQIEARNKGFLPLFGFVRQKMADFCENNFSQPYSGLLVGIIFGIKNLLTDQITRSFRITGLSHIVAASGMNVTLVAGFLFGIFSIFLRRQVAIGLSLAGLFFYVCVSGFEPSIVRAGCMGGLAFAAAILGRQYSGLYVLFFVGAGMLLWDPILLMDVGFQLSVLATAGILVLKPALFGSMLLSDDLTTTLSAQLATLPVIVTTFGQYSLLSVLANALILWTIPLIMTIGGVGILVGLFIEPLGKSIVFLIIPLLWYIEKVTAFFGSHPVLVTVTALPIFFSISYYFFLIALVFFLKKK